MPRGAPGSLHRLGLASTRQPNGLSGIEQGGLHFRHEPLLAALILGCVGQHLRERGGMAEIHQQGHFVRGEAKEMFITVVGDSHATLTQSFKY